MATSKKSPVVQTLVDRRVLHGIIHNHHGQMWAVHTDAPENYMRVLFLRPQDFDAELRRSGLVLGLQVDLHYHTEAGQGRWGAHRAHRGKRRK